MSLTKRYTVTKLYTAYSKRQGSINKRIPLLKNATVEEFNAYILKEYGNVEFKVTKEDPNVFEATVNTGFIYPDRLRLKVTGTGIKKEKKLHFFYGRGQGIYTRGYSIWVAAYSKAEAKRLIEDKCKTRLAGNELNDYFQQSDNNSYNVTEACIYACPSMNNQPAFKI